MVEDGFTQMQGQKVIEEHLSDQDVFLIWCSRQGILPTKVLIHDDNRVWVKTEYVAFGQSVLFTFDGKWLSTRKL